MNFQFYLEKLIDNDNVQNFLRNNKDAYPCSCFFAVDFENLKNPQDKQHIDFFVPSLNRIFSFQLEDNCNIVEIENIGDKALDKISMNYDFDFEEFWRIIEDEKNRQQITHKTQKIIFSIQNVDGKDLIIGTVFISNLGMIRVNYDISERKILLFEKKSFFDLVNVFKKK